MSAFLQEIEDKVLLGDGAMGTQLQVAGLRPGESGDTWNLEHPDRVLAIQRAYVAAGSDCLTTNTFQASSIALERHGLEGKTREINAEGVRIAREAFGDKKGFVLGDVGPFGGLLEPYGPFKAADVRKSFRIQIAALLEAGADVILIETQTAWEEAEIALEEALEEDAQSVILSFAFDVAKGRKEPRTMMGLAPEQAARFAEDSGASVLGTNCGSGIDIWRAVEILKSYRQACSLPLSAQPNAGSPELQGTKVTYKETPDDFAGGLSSLIEVGARIVGSCCGSTPEHIQALRQRLDLHT